MREVNICVVVSDPATITSFLQNHLRRMGQTFGISVVANVSDRELLSRLDINAELISYRIERGISLLNDLVSLWRLILLFRSRMYRIVHSITPKAGLLCMIAAYISRVPIRVHTFTGQRWANRSGLQKVLFREIDRLIARLATHVLIDSFSQRNYLLQYNIVAPEKSFVLAYGSIAGVDVERFSPNQLHRLKIRGSLCIPGDAFLFIFLGRLNVEKGIVDLATAFANMSRSSQKSQLLLVGKDEENLIPIVKDICKSCLDRVHFVPEHTDKPEYYLSASDVLCLPSYREGFDVVIIEAAAAGIPSLGSKIYGISDAIDEGNTGILHTPGNVQDLTEKMLFLSERPLVAHKMGIQARHRVTQLFRQEVVTSALIEFYNDLISKNTADCGVYE